MDHLEGTADIKAALQQLNEARILQLLLQVQLGIELPGLCLLLTELGKDFSELLGAAMAEDEGAVTITKSRLEKSLLRLKRLYGLNLESVF